MLKLISLQGFLNLSANAERKIQAALQPLGLDPRATEKYDDTDEFLDAIVDAVDAGDTVIASAENEEYNSVKRLIMGRFNLSGDKNKTVSEIIEAATLAPLTRIHDKEGHCFMPSDGEIYITNDGLYCGFCIEFSNGARIIYLPLDETRLDVLLSYAKDEISPNSGKGDEVSKESNEAENPESEDTSSAEKAQSSDEEAEASNAEEASAEEEASDEETEKPAGKESTANIDIFSEEADKEKDDEKEDQPLTLRNGDSVSIDDSADEADLTGFDEALIGAARTSYQLIQLDKKVAFVNNEVSGYLSAMCKRTEGLSDAFEFCDVHIENETELETQIVLAKKSRLAIKDTGAEFGAAISPVIEGERDGKPFYFSYIIIHDGASAKAKKVSTSSKQGIDNLIPHAFSVMFQLLAQKAEILSDEEAETEQEDKGENRKKIIILTAFIAGALIAVISAVIMVWSYFSKTSDMFTTAPPPQNPLITENPAPSTTAPPTSLPPASNSDPNNTSLTTDPNYSYPAEPTAGNVTNSQSNPMIASTQGVFTFTVYGYGHGVGMSQTGANYYASIGKTYLEILAMYYYGATLVLGDTYPETITFGGNVYATRDYLATVVESEMGASYNLEALKAQAVAAYTYAKYCNYSVVSTAHAFDKSPSEQAYKAVDAVIGQYITYNGEVCQTFYHATSAGKTTSYSNAFAANQIPYLSGGRPSYGDVTVENYMTTVTMTSDELKALIYSKTGIELTGDPATWIKIISHDACINENVGYVAYVQVGDQVYSGYKFRLDVLGGAIRSHCFTFTYTPTAG